MGEDKANIAMRAPLSTLRLQVEHSLAESMPGALTPRRHSGEENMSCGIDALDQVLQGGLPAGAIAELVGPESSGRTTAAVSFLARITAKEHVCAWIDVADSFDPGMAAANGVVLERLLWVRCASGIVANPLAPDETKEDREQRGERPLGGALSKQPLPAGGGGSPHPRGESRGMSQAIANLLDSQPRSGALQASRRHKRAIGTPGMPNRPLSQASMDREEQVPTDRQPARRGNPLAMMAAQGAASATRDAVSLSLETRKKHPSQYRPYDAMDRAMRATDLLLQAGGFRTLVLDLGSIPPEQVWRIPLATWFRFRAACERTRVSLLLLTQHPCARSSAQVVLRMHAGKLQHIGPVMTGIAYRGELERQRNRPPVSNLVPMRKPVQSQEAGVWAARSMGVPS
jgi:recombination protein RecA